MEGRVLTSVELHQTPKHHSHGEVCPPPKSPGILEEDKPPAAKHGSKSGGRGLFSSHTGKASYRQHKPHVNRVLAGLLCSGVTMRRAAIVVGINRKTVAKKLAWMGSQARAAHQEFLRSRKLCVVDVQFDELETCERTKLKPLSIALAVSEQGGEILGCQVATMNCHGHKAATSVGKYGRRLDTRQAACAQVMQDVAKVAASCVTVATDQKASYRKIIANVLPTATHTAYLSRRNPAQWFDALFTLNIACAKLRADLARLRRRTWAISKKPQCLQDHLDLYVAFNNKYALW